MADKRLGRHILVEFYNCDSQILNNAQQIERYMTEASSKAKATVVKSVFHTFNPWGLLGLLLFRNPI